MDGTSGMVSSDTTVTISNSHFIGVRDGIWLSDPDPNDSVHVLATISGAMDRVNLFEAPINFDVFLSGVTNDINAQYNDWSYCDPAQIESVMYHHPDDPTLGTVDYSNAIMPVVCLPTFTPGPTPSPTPSPSPTPFPHRKHGDLNCDGSLNGKDALGPLDYVAGESFGQHLPCPNLGDSVQITSIDSTWGDVDCSGAIDAQDAIDVLESVADLPYPHDPSCPDVGSTVTVGT